MEREFEEYIHTKVPLTGVLRLGVQRATTDEVVFTLPLSGNDNDKGTLFAGASASGLTFCCWALAELLMRRFAEEHRCAKPIAVAKETNVKYLKPVTTDSLVTCKAPAKDVVDEFCKTLHEHGKARIALSATLTPQGSAVHAAELTGTYVALVAKQ